MIERSLLDLLACERHATELGVDQAQLVAVEVELASLSSRSAAVS